MQSLSVLPKKENSNATKKGNRLGGLLDSLINNKINSINDKSDAIGSVKARKLFDARRKHRPEVESAKSKHAEIVEKELQAVISRQYSALKDNPYVEKKGQNDFLVLQAEEGDPFVTIIPNNIYYPVEKKCVNWLDDCSIQGIRARLLEKVMSPYK